MLCEGEDAPVQQNASLQLQPVIPKGMFKHSRASAASQEHAELPFKEER